MPLKLPSITDMIKLGLIGLVLFMVLPKLVVMAGTFPLFTIMGLSIIFAAGVVYAGAIWINKQKLVDPTLTMAKYAVYMTAFAIVGTTLYGVLNYSFSLSNGQAVAQGFIATLIGIVTQAGGESIVYTAAIVLLGSTILYGAYQDMKHGGDQIARILFRVFFVGVILAAVMLWLFGSTFLGMAGSKIQVAARLGLLNWIMGQPVELHIDWMKVGGIAFATFLAFVFLHQYFKANKIAVTTAVSVASIAFVMLSYIFAMEWEPSARVLKETGLAIQQANPFAGETRTVDLRGRGEITVADFGPFDSLITIRSFGGCVSDVVPTQRWKQQNAALFDGFNDDNFARLEPRSETKSNLLLSEGLEERLLAADKKMDLVAKQICP